MEAEEGEIEIVEQEYGQIYDDDNAEEEEEEEEEEKEDKDPSYELPKIRKSPRKIRHRPDFYQAG